MLHDVNITGTVTVEDGKTLDITGIVGVDGVRPAIDGGGTPGCTSNCPGHRVFYVGQNAPSNLTLTNVTIRNGYVCIIYLFHFQLLSSIMIIIILTIKSEMNIM